MMILIQLCLLLLVVLANNMATKKPVMSKAKPKHKAPAKEPKMIKPPAPRKPVKTKSSPRTTNSRTGALGATSPY